MPHLPGHSVDGQGFQGQFAPEFQGSEFQRSLRAGIEPANTQRNLRLGQISRTRQLSPAQEALLLSQGQQAQSESLVNAQIQADLARIQQEAGERLIGEQRQFQSEEEAARFQRDRALQERLQSQNLLGSIFGNLAGLGGTFLGAGLGGPIGTLATGIV